MTLPEYRLGVSVVQASAIAQVDGDLTRGGLPVPRMTTTERDAIVSPADGLEIFNTTTHTKNLYQNGAWVSIGSSSGSAPADATYITQTANSGLSAEQALSTLATGLMQVTTTTGVVSSVTTSAGLAALISDETGGGALVFATSPTLVTPVLGVASATSLALADGLVGTPSLLFTSDTNTGLYRVGADQLGITAGGVLIATYSLVGSVRTFSMGDGAGTGDSFNINGAAGTDRSFFSQSNSSNRWKWAVADGTAEGGADAGSNMSITARHDDGSSFAFFTMAFRRSNGSVGIGIAPTSITAFLHMVGVADQVQHLVKANATQTSNLIEWQNSSGAVLLGFSNGAALTLNGDAARTFSMARHATSNTAGNNLTVQSGGATLAATNKAAGALVLATGVNTGSAIPALIQLQGGVMNPTSGTGDNANVDRLIANASKVLTNNSAITIVNATAAAALGYGGVIHYMIEVYNGTDLQVEIGYVEYGGVNKAGAFTTTITEVSSHQAVSSGTLATTWAISSANPAAISVNANSSLTPNAGYPRITYSVQNFGQQAIAAA